MPSHEPDFLAHHPDDAVAVAVRDLVPGRVEGGALQTQAPIVVELVEPVPLGHKLALRDVPDGADVVEYGVRIGIAATDIRAGQHVHVHNLRSARWQTSVA